jgi:hypothetical protein
MWMYLLAQATGAFDTCVLAAITLEEVVMLLKRSTMVYMCARGCTCWHRPQVDGTVALQDSV